MLLAVADVWFAQTNGDEPILSDMKKPLNKGSVVRVALASSNVSFFVSRPGAQAAKTSAGHAVAAPAWDCGTLVSAWQQYHIPSAVVPNGLRLEPDKFSSSERPES